MMKLTVLPSAIGLLIALCLPTAPAQAQAASTWVASFGNDGNSCSRSAPCATFQGAHDKSLGGGEINCVDAGNFMTVVITKSITIDCGGMFGGIRVEDSITSGIAINASGINVRLRNLSIQGFVKGNHAISFLNGNALFVENCAIWGFNSPFGGIGIAFIPSAGSSQLYVSDSVIEGNGTSVQGGSGGGIVIKPSGSASVRASIDRVRVNSNIYGIFANGTGTTGVIAVQVHDSVVSGNSFGGISAYTAAGKGITSITIDRTSSTLNGAAGVLAQGAPAFAILSQSVVIGNGTGLSAVDGSH